MCKTNIEFIAATIQNCEKKISMLFYVRIKKGLVHAMHRNGPLHQVLLSVYFCCTNYYSVLAVLAPIHSFQALLLTSGQGCDMPNPLTSMQAS